jgi:hypothetical protein
MRRRRKDTDSGTAGVSSISVVSNFTIVGVGLRPPPTA